MCVACLSEPPAVGILHGTTVHLCLCHGCALQHYGLPPRRGEGGVGGAGAGTARRGVCSLCPLCRARIERLVRVY